MDTILLVTSKECTQEGLVSHLSTVYNVISVSETTHAMNIITSQEISAILLDFLDCEVGKEVLQEWRRHPQYQHIPLVLTARTYSDDMEVACLRNKVSEFIVAPFAQEVVIARMDKVLELAKYRLHMEEKVIEKVQELESLSMQAIIAIINTVDAKDEYTRGHSLRVAMYAEELAKAMGMSAQECQEIATIASLHDVGKIGIPDAVLKKGDALNEEEYTIMKTHATLGAKIVEGLHISDQIELGALYHHEHYDGSGYPHGLKGDEIPLVARIIGVADAFDAMVTNRCYREGKEIEAIRQIFVDHRGTQFDPRICDLMVSMLDDKKTLEEWLVRNV